MPLRLVGAEVELCITATTAKVLTGGARVAAHAYSVLPGKHTTLAEYMPVSHRTHREWSPATLIVWGERIGVATAAVVRWQMEPRPHPEQGYRACLGMQRPAREFTPARLEAACIRAMAIRSPNLRSVTSILRSGLDRQPLPPKPAQANLPLHENLRGPDYYQ